MVAAGSKRALITGVTGQDGSYTAELLLQNGYEVIGVTRDPGLVPGPNLDHLAGKVKLVSCSYNRASLIDLLSEFRPSEIYNFAGQTYVSKSWELLDETIQSSALRPIDLLEAVIYVDKGIRFFHASSCEIFSGNAEVTFDEATPVVPGNPYGSAKAFAHHMVNCYRQNYGIYAVNGILFHHESPRRHANFASRKIVNHAVAIKLGHKKELRLGNMDVWRDWSYAPDVVRCIERMMSMDEPRDLVIASGEPHSLVELVQTAFERVGLDYHDYLRIDKSLFRVAEPAVIRGSSAAATRILDWRPKTSFRAMVEKMVDYEMRLQTGQEKDFGSERPFA